MMVVMLREGYCPVVSNVRVCLQCFNKGRAIYFEAVHRCFCFSMWELEKDEQVFAEHQIKH